MFNNNTGVITKFVTFYQNLKFHENIQTFVYSEFRIVSATETTIITLFLKFSFFLFLSKFLDAFEQSSVTDGQEHFP